MQDVLFQHVVNWLTLGCIYSLFALGFSLLFGVLQVIHFSHGDVAMVAPYVALIALHGAGGGDLPITSLLLAGAIAVLAIGCLGVALDRLVIQRFRNAPAMMAMVATVALGIAIRELIRHLYPEGSNPQTFPALAEGRIMTPLGTVPILSLVAVLSSVGLVGLLLYALHRTSIGMRIRAVSQDREAARLFAIAPGPVFRTTFFVASAVAAVGALLLASHAGLVRFDFGIQAGLIGFSAAVVGGLGRLGGAIVGSMLIAGIDTFAQAYVHDGSSYRLVFIFVLVIAVLVFRPAGLFGRNLAEKV